MYSDIIVIGGGASGMMAAIHAANKNQSVLILEHNQKLGKKILVTGNGKCNYTNLVQSEELYRGTDPSFAMKVLSRFDVSETLSFFKKLGILPKDKNGYLYPDSEQASSIASALINELENKQVHVQKGVHVNSIQKIDDILKKGANDSLLIKDSLLINDSLHNKNTFLINAVLEDKTQTSYTCQNIILANGGCAAPKQGSDGSGYQLSASLGHTIIPPLPGLVSLEGSGRFCKSVSGVRREAKALLQINTNQYTESGEIIFTDTGVSGIPIMQLSRYASKALASKLPVRLILDLYPLWSQDLLLQFLLDTRKHNHTMSSEALFWGSCNQKLVYAAFLELKLAPTKPAYSMTQEDILRVINFLKNLVIPITGTGDFEHAQVTLGGVSTKEINSETLESTLVKGLYIIGELLDIDGTCGGYNLQWAWSSGALAGKAVSKKMENI